MPYISYICLNLKIPTKRAFCMAFWVEKEFNYLKVTFNQFYEIFTYFSPNLYKKSWYHVNPQNTLFPWKIFYLQTFSTTVKPKFLQKYLLFKISHYSGISSSFRLFTARIVYSQNWNIISSAKYWNGNKNPRSFMEMGSPSRWALKSSAIYHRVFHVKR